MQAPLAFRAKCFGGPISQVGVLKVVVLDVGSKPLVLGEASSWEVPPDYRLCARGGIYCEKVPQAMLSISMWVMWVFSHSPKM